MPNQMADETPDRIRKSEPMSHGRTDLRKRKPHTLAVINQYCTGCAGSPACIVYCPVEMCMFWIPDDDHPPYGRIEVDKTTCIGCAKCTSKGPDGIFLDGCPWDAIEMVSLQEWETARGVDLPTVPDSSGAEWELVPGIYV